MRIYVAAMYALRTTMMSVHRELIRAGHEPTSRWVEGAEEGLTDPQKAVMGMEDVARADALLCYTYERGKMFSGGGRHVELGMALAMGRRVFIIGGLENIFHHHPCVKRYASLDEFLVAWPPGSTPALLPLPSLENMLQERNQTPPPHVVDEGGGP